MAAKSSTACSPKSSGQSTPDLQTGLALHKAGKLADAQAVYRAILERDPHHADAFHYSGVIAHQVRQDREAVRLIRTAIRLEPNKPLYYQNLADALHATGDIDQAIGAYQKALALHPTLTAAHHNLGNLYQQRGNVADAQACYERALAIDPNYIASLLNLGSLHKTNGALDAAGACFRAVIERQPDMAAAHFNLGNVHKERGDLQAAATGYHEALRCDPGYGDAHFNLGYIYFRQGHLAEAAGCYRHALAHGSGDPQVHHNLGKVLRVQGRLDEARQCVQKALALQPAYAGAAVSLGNIYYELKNPDEAVRWYRHALQCDPKNAEATAFLVHLFQQICDWQALAELAPRLDRLTARALQLSTKCAETPFMSICRRDDPQLNFTIARACSRRVAKRTTGLGTLFTFDDRRPAGDKMTIGYLSNRFRNTATAHLSRSLFGLHDRKRFNVFCYSYGEDDRSEYRRTIEAECDRFVDVRTCGFADAARQIHADRVDILVDLQGHTHGGRMEICALRPAPVQVHFLVYPGTTGAAFMDYMVTDKIVAPEAHAAYFSENLVHLPHTYQVNDHNQPVTAGKITRTDCGLPQDEVVFCSFNQSYKIEPVMFAVWMRILDQVPGSVLWLQAASEQTQRNLQAAAEANGIAAKRFVFAPKKPKADHLARLRLADVCLDTRIYNGHTTTSDALWAGVPVVALRGNHFASRVSAALLTACNRPDLVAEDLPAYEHLAVQLARDPGRRRRLRRQIEEDRATAPLFDTRRYVRNLEKAFEEMWRLFQAGKLPAPIKITE